MVVGYVRLSKEDKNKDLDKNSKSIENQIQYIKYFAKSKDIKIDKFYIDDGYSGVNYIRPQFESMINDLKKNNIDTIITKDFSRLGREYIETNYYIYRYFPENNIRFIAIDDGYDSMKDSSNNMYMLIKTIVNDRYIKSISESIKKVKEIKSKSGNFLGYIAPYGYIKLKEKDRTTLIIDKKVKYIVKYIFKSIANKYTLSEVANKLNYRKIDSPIQYLKINNGKNLINSKKWSRQIIYRIIRNPIYVGDSIYRKTEKQNYNETKRSYLNSKKRKIIKNTHEAIIDRETFIKANENIPCRREKIKRVVNKDQFYEENYSKFLCEKCGKRLDLIQKNNTNYLKCKNCKFIKSYNKVKRNIYEIFYNIIRENTDKEKIIIDIYKLYNSLLKRHKYVANTRKNIFKTNIKLLYLQKVEDEISRPDFNNIKNRINLVNNYHTINLRELTNLYDKFIKELKISCFINTVYISDKIKIFFNFKF